MVLRRLNSCDKYCNTNGSWVDLLSRRLGIIVLHNVIVVSISKLVEAIIAAILILVVTVQVLLDVRMRGSFQLGFTQVIQLLMLVTLICTYFVSR